MFTRPSINVFILGLAVLLPASLGLAADSKSGDKLSRSDSKFIKEAAEGSMMEVELGKLAQQKASNERVKEFGRRMEQDHGKALEELKKLASAKGVELPNELEGKHKRTYEKLSKLSGEQFDREYMRTMINDHKEDVKEFQRESQKAKDPDVKKFASEELPILKEHLQLAQSTGQQVAAKGKERSR